MATRKRLIIALAILLLASIGGVWLARARYINSTSVVRAQQGEPSEGSLRWYAQQAHASQQSSISLLISANPLIANNLSEAISNNSVVVGELIEQKSVWYDPPDTIYTWYKFQLTETLTQKPYVPCENCTFSPTPPSELLPLQAGQVLLPLLGGTTVIDDIAFETRAGNVTPLVSGQKYLLFLNLNPDTSIGTTKPQGIVLVNSDNTFASVLRMPIGESEPIVYGLATQYANSLNQLRNSLNPPPPSSCDPVQQQNCTDDGGTWNSNSCTCTPAFDPCLRKPWLCE